MVDFNSDRAKAFAERFERTRLRRNDLKYQDNPSQHMDYVVTLRTQFPLQTQQKPVAVIIRYVPDRHIMSPEAMEDYIQKLNTTQWNSIEELATAIADDFKNELMTRWCHVLVKGELTIGGVTGEHSIAAEDHLPGWKNEKLLSHLTLS